MPTPPTDAAMRRPIVGGNWKMHLRREECVRLAQAVTRGAATLHTEIVVFPPLVYLDAVAGSLRTDGSIVALGAQDVSWAADGAFTGEVSVGMLRDLSVTACLAGHSERRHVIGESDEIVRGKTHAILEAGMTCVLCIGETLAQREAGQTDHVNEKQLHAALNGVDAVTATAHLVVAYEPVWAIGAGRNATPEDAQSAHLHIRNVLAGLFDRPTAQRIRVQYGGSVKASNAQALFSQPDIDGGLIGGASLKSEDFLAICRAATPTA